MADTQHVLTLDINNLTVGEDGSPSSGYSNEEIYVVIQGKVDDNYNRLDWTTGAFIPMSTADNTTKLNYLGLPTAALYADYGMKLSEILKQSWMKDGKIVIPTPIVGGRAYISFQRPVYLSIIASDSGVQSPAEPADEAKTDPNYSTIWDKFEFTVTANKEGVQTLWSNTTAVDFVGIPMSFQLTKGSKTIGPLGFEIPEGNKSDPMAFIIDEISKDPEFSVLVSNARLFSPKVSDGRFGPAFGEDGTFMDNYIDFCWSQYSDPATPITLSNFVAITAAENSSVGTDEKGASCKWTATGFIKNEVLIFTLESIITADCVTVDLPTNKTFTIAKPSSYNTLRQGGVFTKDKNLHPADYTQAIDGDIKNQVSTALNRSVMHKEFITDEHWWADVSKFYIQKKLSDNDYRTNRYSMWMHEKSYEHLCYALAYDDKYSRNVNISETIDNIESVLELNLYYKKGESANVKIWESPNNTSELSVGVEGVEDQGGVARLWFKSSETLQGDVILMFEPKEGEKTENYTASKMELVNDRYELKFIPGNLNNPFRFYIKYLLENTTAQLLLPSDAIPAQNVFDYNF